MMYQTPAPSASTGASRRLGCSSSARKAQPEQEGMVHKEVGL